MTSCGVNPSTPSDTSTGQIRALQEEVTRLKLENAGIREENNLLRAGGDPTTIGSSFGSDTDTSKTYTEGSYDTCMKQAYDDYIRQGSEKCVVLGYSSGEILTDKCQLDTPVITELKSTRALAEGECKKLYK